ncbi:MAG: ROK family protein [Acidimicrobiales bacterium]
MTETIGVDIGGTKCLGVVLDAAGSIVTEDRRPTPKTGSSLVETVVSLVDDLGGDPTAVGVGAPGLVDHEGRLRFAPHLPGVVELELRRELSRARPQVRFAIDNDATCAARAETALGAAAGYRDVLLVTIGTGIGGGIVADGRVLRGRNGFAGEIGHVIVESDGLMCPCGQRGCWERYASGSGLGWMAREAAQAGRAPRMVELAGGDPEAVRGEHVTAAANDGDPEAVEVMERFAWWVAVGLANLANILDPELIVLGGGIVSSGAVVLEPTRAAFFGLLEGARHRPTIELVAARLGERAGAVGAALLAREDD